MKIIKFRVWDKKNKVMASWKFIKEFYDFNELDNNKTFLQFTGLKDKKGKEIYEGDIIKITNNDLFDEPLKIIWYEPIARFGMQELNSYCCWDFNPKRMREMKVMGNIYENKELLKE